MYCSSCGSLIKDDQSFCANCGAPVASVLPAPQPEVRKIQSVQNMAGSDVKKIPAAAKVFGWISIILSGLGIIGAVLISAASAMPSSSSVLIQSEDAARITLFFFGMILGLCVSSLGGVSGIISLITMLVKKNKKMIWLPITGIALGVFAFFATILSMVNMFG